LLLQGKRNELDFFASPKKNLTQQTFVVLLAPNATCFALILAFQFFFFLPGNEKHIFLALPPKALVPLFFFLFLSSPLIWCGGRQRQQQQQAAVARAFDVCFVFIIIYLFLSFFL
jgi:hypothetical protein